MFESVKSAANTILNVFRTDSVIESVDAFNFTEPSGIAETFRIRPKVLTQGVLDTIYTSEGIGKKIVSCVVEDAMRSFIDCDIDLLEELERVGAKKKIEEAGKFGRLFGGALLVAMVDDGQELEAPIRLDNNEKPTFIYKVHNLQVYDRHQIFVAPEDICVNIYSDFYGLPEYYQINAQPKRLRIHRSRCCVLGGESTTNYQKRKNQGWDHSVLNTVYSALVNYLESQECTVSVQRDFVQVVIKIKGLIESLAQADGLSKLDQRIAAINVLRQFGIKNSIVMEADSEDYTKHSSNLSGFADATDRIAEYLSAVSGIPVARLFGRSAGGLNSTGHSDMQNYYDTVRSWRNDQAAFAIQWIIDLLAAQQSWEKRPANLTWEFPSLTAPTEKEQAEIRKIYSDIDFGYADRQAIDLRDAYKERFGTGKFHENIKIGILSDEEMSELLEEDISLLTEEEEKKRSAVDEKQQKTDQIIDKLHKKVGA